jgi:hypothetical protein
VTNQLSISAEQGTIDLPMLKAAGVLSSAQISRDLAPHFFASFNGEVEKFKEDAPILGIDQDSLEGVKTKARDLLNILEERLKEVAQNRPKTS